VSRRAGFWLCFSILALIGLFPALRLRHRLDRRWAAIEYQTKVDLKRERIAPWLEALGKIRSANWDPAAPADWLNLHLLPGGGQADGFLRFLAVDGQGAIILAWKRSTDSSQGWQSERFDPSSKPNHPARTRSTETSSGGWMGSA
jgi:hypothetical protein